MTNLFLTVLEAGRSESKAPADSLPGRALLLVCRWPPFYCVLTWQKKRSSLSSLFLKGANPIHEASILMTQPHPKSLTSKYDHMLKNLSMRCEETQMFSPQHDLGNTRLSWMLFCLWPCPPSCTVSHFSVLLSNSWLCHSYCCCHG